LGLETFYITKEGDVVHREIVNFPGKIKRWLPIVIMVFLGLLAIGGPILVSLVLSARGGTDEQQDITVKVAIEPDTVTPGVAIEVPTVTPVPAPKTATPFPTPTGPPTNTPVPRVPKFKIGDELILTMGSGDAQRQFPATVIEVYRLGGDFDLFWEYQVRWPNGLIRVQEFILSREDETYAEPAGVLERSAIP